MLTKSRENFEILVKRFIVFRIIEFASKIILPKSFNTLKSQFNTFFHDEMPISTSLNCLSLKCLQLDLRSFCNDYSVFLA